ncbi:Uncharacterised protein [Bordetella pertussis]|nr:Uncharacterised protein [Bordetella pertussis]
MTPACCRWPPGWSNCGGAWAGLACMRDPARPAMPKACSS